MSNKNYENQILDAIQLLVDSAISKANFDKTIKGIVSKCIDQSKGEYVIKYQDSSFYAYSNDLEQVYSSGTSVYVLVPNNDMTQTKTILGSVNKLGSDYINVKENIDDYQTIGNSIISTDQEFGVCSYVPGGDAIVLYDKVNNINLIDVNEFAANAYLKQSNYLIVGADFRTTLDNNQKYKGNYGLAFKLAFLDPMTNENVSRTYLVDVNTMTGNPYEYINKSEQRVVFEIDGQNFEEIETITLFSYDFPNQDEEIQSNDIFASGLILEGANILTEEEIGGNALIITTPQGIYFDENDLMTAHRDIITEVRINNKIIPANSDALQYYWFRENPKINSNSEKYNRYGGNGWECLNSFNNLGTNEADQPIIDWLSAQSSYVTTKASNPAKETDYKCIVVYNKELVLSKIITIFNYSSLYNITIESNTGTYFSYNNGKPTLTATINGDAPSAYTYKWSIIDNNNRFNVLEETTTLNIDYYTKQNRYDEIKNGLEDGSILLTAAIQTELSNLMYSLQEYEKIMRVESNVVYNLNLNIITNFSIFICSIYDAEDNYLGKGKIEIINDINGDANAYTLVINNGDQVFKYNEQGIAPTSKSLENPQELYPLSFTLYDEHGLEINSNIINANNVSWTVPTTETMINISDVHGNPSEIDTLNETKTYTGYKELYFNIPTIYSANKKRNTIELKVKYKNKVVIVKKELTFIKEGEVGTNGTNYICKIIPNVLGTAEIPKYVIYRYNNTTNIGSLNYEPTGEGLWFKAQLYKDGVNIFNGTASGDSNEGKAVTVEWSMLINKYDNIHSDLSNFAINNGLFSFIDANKDIDNPANIVKCTITYENQTYYATMPIIYVNAAAPYKAEPIESTGFQYAMYTTDGTRPIYDTTNPFALEITQAINNVDTDISITTDSQYALDDYDWSVEGEVYSAGSPIAQSNLIRRTITIDNLAKNEAKFYPIEKFDGFCVNNGLLCKISRNSEILLKIHLPIHLYLNRYGNSALNGWDGNHIEINDEGGFILAPQIGAGKKEADNSYTGVFMGTVREAGSNKEEVGLFGYNSGIRTIELDAQDGSAKFGREGQGQIIISPDDTNDHSVIKSGGYTPPVLDAHGNIITPGQGLEIDLTDPHITFGSGNFRVDKDGNVSATGFATISQLEAGNINIPGIENWKTISATDSVQFEVNSQYYPAANTNKSITCQGSYKDEIVNGYTATLINSSGSAISNPSTINGITIQVNKNTSSNDTIITFSVNQSAKITNATNTFYVKFTHTASNLSIIKAFYVNLIILGQDGAKGEQGPAGPAGKDGTSVTIKGSYDTLSQLIAAHPSGNTLGDGYVVGLNLYVYTNAGGGGGSQTSDWNDVGQFKGEDAKRCFIVASSEVFKSTDNGTTYIPNSATITPYLQAVNFNSWAYDKNDGSGYRPLSGTLPTGIAINNNIITVANNSEIFDASDTVLFKCTTDNKEVYDIITITRVKDGANGRGIFDTEIKYVADSQGITPPADSASWSNNPPTGDNKGKFIWTRTRITYTDNNNPTTSYSVSYEGTNGTNGDSITITTQEIKYAEGISGTTHPDSGWQTTIPAVADTHYLWTRTYVKYSDNTETTSYSVSYQSKDGVNGTSATNVVCGNEAQIIPCDKDGKVIAQTDITIPFAGYVGSTRKACSVTPTDLPDGITIQNNTAATTSADGSLVLRVAANSTLGGATSGTVTLTFRCNSLSFVKKFAWSKAIKGADGANGRGISSITNYYLATSASSGVTRDTTGWTTDVQTMTATNQYLWNYEDILYTNSTHTYTNPAIIGRYGQNGAAGKGIASIVEYYAINNSTIAPADSAFDTQVVAPTADNKYLWNYELITYNNPTSTSKTDKRIIGTYGRDGTNGTSPYFSYLTNETQSFVYGTATTATTQLYGYQGTTEKTVQIKTVNGVAVATTDTATGKTGMNFKVSSTSAASHPTITFTTTTALPQGATERLAIVYRVTGESTDRTIYFSYSTTTRGAQGPQGNPGANAQLLTINPSSQIFKSTEGAIGTFTPQYIYLYPTFQNCTYSKWQYSTNGTTWTDVTSGSNSLTTGTYDSVANSLRIERTSNLYTDSITAVSFKCIATDATVYDTVTIVKIYDVTDLEIGGTNLVLNSKTMSIAAAKTNKYVSSYSSGDLVLREDGFVEKRAISIFKGICAYANLLDLEVGEWINVQCLAKNVNVSSAIRISLYLMEHNEAGTRIYINTDFLASGKKTTGNSISLKNLETGQKEKISVAMLWNQELYDLIHEQNGDVILSFQTNSTFTGSDTEYIAMWAMKVEKGNVATDWTPAPEDVDSAIEDVQNVANAAYAQAQSALITYTTTDTANPPGTQAVWVSSLPSAPDKYIWQRIEYKFLDSTRDYSTQPTCIYTPTRITNELQYCLCSTNNYSESAKTNDWQSESFPWDDSYYTSAGVGNITINRYQFVRNKYTDTNKEEDAVTYSIPILDQSWYMFGYKLASEAVAREALASSINNNIVEINGQNGVTISSANAQYGIRLTSVGLQFLLNGEWTTVWNINGTLDANLITVKDLRADNILSGTLTLNTTDNNGSFVLNSTYGESSRIDGDGIKVTTSDGATVHIKTGAGEGISAKTQSNVEYFNVDPDTQQTTMKNSQVDNTLGLGTNIKVVQITHGVAFIGIYTNGS